ncbi:MAG: linear amide C-N hydrolase, partial [Clostridiales bacterium]|nr:linear amide C-N hydrolase [Clostridiales bacterium]
VGHNSPISPDSPLGKFIMVTTPYFVVDGMNEKGVAAGILTVGTDEPHQDNGKPDLLVYCAVRGILDNCASVDEAITLLASYDIHSDLGNYHLFITDKTGRYVVVEWLDNKMVTVDYPCCTNSVIAPGEYYDMGIRDGRKDTIEACLGNDRIVSAKEAMAILEKVKDKIGMTEWSCVYDLDNFTVSICINADYSVVYTFDVRDFR